MIKWFGWLGLGALLAGCLSETVSVEGGWDPAGRVRLNGLYQSVWVSPTSDTGKDHRVFYRFRNDGTFWIGVSQYFRPMYPDSVVSSDTTSRFFLWWERRGKFELTTDSIRYFDFQTRISDYNDVFPEWNGMDSVRVYSQNIAGRYCHFTSDLWIGCQTPLSGGSEDSSYLVVRRIGDENMAIPWAELRQ